MFNYLAFLYGGCPEASGDPFADGGGLARQCLEQLSRIDNSEQFPPGLLILLASPAYLEVAQAKQLLAGIHQAFAVAGHHNVPLIGSSVAAVFFDRRVHARGAMLVCLASRMLEAKIAVSLNARYNTEQAAGDLLDLLELNFSGKGRDPNPLVNRLLLTFFPGFGIPKVEKWYPAPELHRHLRQKLRARVPIVGGGSSSNNMRRPGLQFANREAYIDALVGARVTTGFPFTSSFGHGLSPKDGLLRIEKLSGDRRTILSFKEGVPTTALNLGAEKSFEWLGEMSLEDDPVVNVAWSVVSRPGVVQTLREVNEETVFNILAPEVGAMRKEAAHLAELSLYRLRIERAVGCLGIHSAARLELGLEINDLTDDVEKLLIEGGQYVGGFFDGEVGISQTGRSLFGNGCVATVCFGDEMRERTPFYTGFEAMAKFAEKLKRISSFDQAIDCSVDLISQTGFSGAMISLLLENEDGKWIVAKGARGSRFEKIQTQAKRPFDEDGLFARIARGEEPPFIRDSRVYFQREMAVLKGSKIISQYVAPLKNTDGDPIAFLQVDLGDARYKNCLQDSEQHVLDSLVASVESTMSRLLNRVEANIARALDEALKESLAVRTISEALQRYIESAVRIFGADMGHIRLKRQVDDRLVMVAGVGPYYEAFRQQREVISIESDSPASQAFRSGEQLVVNNAPMSDWQRKLLQECQASPIMTAALQQAGSYANVAFHDEQGNSVGTINLISQPWFFTRAHVRSLEAVAQRIGFLLDHLRRRVHLQFLSEVGTDFVRTADFRKPLETLTEATKLYCKAANAEVASLYLWDREVEQFILRAEYGWHVSGWVDAARYGENDRWTGRVALADKPQYVPDLYDHKQKHSIDSNRHFEIQRFGKDLSAEFTVEALGLPLKLKEKSLGVLTLHRRIRPERAGKSDGFTTTDPQVLQRAADNLVTMVSAQLYYLRVLWEREEIERHAEVCIALEQPDRKWSLEETLCRQMLSSFQAKQVAFYLADSTREGMALTWGAGFRRRQFTAEAIPPTPPDDLIQQALGKKLVEEFHKIPESGWKYPEVVKKNGWVERVCLQLRDDKQHVVGVLDVHWNTKRRPLRPLLTPHGHGELTKLGQEIGATYQRQKKLAQQKEAKEQAERNRLAAQTMGVMLFQSAHRLMNLVQDLSAMPDLIAAAESAEERQQRIAELSHLINSAVDKIRRPMDIASRTRRITPQLHNLRGLLEQVLSDLGRGPTIKVQWKTPESVIVRVDENLVKEAFRNIIRNAMQAMADGGVLELRATLQHKNHVRITFADTGNGMDEEEIEAAMSGFVSTRGGTGLGVLVSLILIRANNGNLYIESKKGEGTQVVVTLPVETTEEDL